MVWRQLARRCALAIFFAGTATGAARAVTFTSDSRLTIEDFARAHEQNPAAFEARYAATGMVVCNGVYSTGQLTLRDDIVTTAAHAFYDPSGHTRGDLSACVFVIRVDGTRRAIPLAARTLTVGTTNPYPLPPSDDWAVVRLTAPVADARPYQLGESAPGLGIALLAHRHRGWIHDGRRAIEDCRIRNEIARPFGTEPREIDIDCSAGDGASGSAIMLPDATCRMVGIYIGWRSSHPDEVGAYGPDHLNFGIAVEGSFRSAILAAVSAEDHERDAVPVAAMAPAVVNASTGPAALPAANAIGASVVPARAATAVRPTAR